MKMFWQKNDDELVDNLRTQYKRWWSIVIGFVLFAGMFVAYTYSGVTLERKYLKFSKSLLHNGNSTEANIASVDYMMGYQMGCITCLGVCCGALGISICSILILKRRQDALLIKYHDELKKIRVANEEESCQEQQQA